jgi:hypothetical protein
MEMGIPRLENVSQSDGGGKVQERTLISGPRLVIFEIER